MGFFSSEIQVKEIQKGDAKKVNTATLHKMECRLCPLNHAKVNTPKMEPRGSFTADIYVLGEFPDSQDDSRGKAFSGPSGRFFRDHLAKEYEKRCRFNTIIRTPLLKNRAPTYIEIECCRPSIIRDIEKTKPKIIIGLGPLPLKWATGFNDIGLWRGRRIAVQIGNHKCWYFPTYHPSFCVLMEKAGNYMCKKVFIDDVQHSLKWLDNKYQPEIENEKEHLEGVTCIDGSRGREDVKRVKTHLKNMISKKYIGWDYETKGLRPYHTDSKILSVALSDGIETVAIALEHKQAQWNHGQLNDVYGLLRDFMLEHKGSKIAHNLVFELEWTLKFFGPEYIRPFPGTWDDTMAQAYVIDERSSKRADGPLSLDSLIKIYFGFSLKKLVPLNVKDLDNEPLPDVLLYNAMDSKYTKRLFIAQKVEVKKQKLSSIYLTHKRRIPTVVLSQWCGIELDQNAVRSIQKQLQKRLNKIKKNIANDKDIKRYIKVRGEFNPGSPDQVLRFFRDYIKATELKTINKKTKKEQWSTDESHLEEVKHPVAKNIIEFRKVQKCKSTYVDVFELEEGRCCYPDGMAHTNYNSLFVVTGRLSSDDPNTQNWPKHGWQVMIRKQFIAGDGYVWVSFDYGQIEARVIGMASKDKAFCKALWADYDVHDEWAHNIKRAFPEWMENDSDKDRRQIAKNKFVFPSFFGASPVSIADYLNLPHKPMNKLLNEFWDVFSGVRKWQNKTFAFYKKHGYVEGLTGRRRRGVVSWNEVINTPIQGVASDIVMNSMDRLSEYAQKTGKWQFQARINIHDDLTFALPVATLDEDIEIILDHMLNVPFKFINVPISVEVSVGVDNFHQQEEIGVFKSEKYPKDF